MTDSRKSPKRSRAFTPPPLSPEAAALLERLNNKVPVQRDGPNPNFTPPPLSPEAAALLERLDKASGKARHTPRFHNVYAGRRLHKIGQFATEGRIAQVIAFLGASKK